MTKIYKKKLKPEIAYRILFKKSYNTINKTRIEWKKIYKKKKMKFKKYI